jgi:hypothetical protein
VCGGGKGGAERQQQEQGECAARHVVSGG